MTESTVVSSGRSRRISALRALIDHPRTSEEERGAAEALLRKLGTDHRGHEDNSVRQPRASAWPVPQHACGSRYAETVELPLREIAALIRNEIKARAGYRPAHDGMRDPIAAAPAQLTYSVRCRTERHQSWLNISVGNAPPEWAWQWEPGGPGPGPVKKPSQDLQQLTDELVAILDSYNSCRFLVHNGHTGLSHMRFDGMISVNLNACAWSPSSGLTGSPERPHRNDASPSLPSTDTEVGIAH